MNAVLAYDLGTSGVKAALYDQSGEIVASTIQPCLTQYPLSGFHEQKPADWWTSVVNATRNLLCNSMVNPMDIRCLALSGHSLGAVPLREDGTLLSESVPIWSDSRAVRQSEIFFRKVDQTGWYLRTGNGFPAHLYSVFKMMWFRDHHPEIYDQTALFLGTKDYINFKLTGVFATDHSYASGSGVYDLLAHTYADDLIEASCLKRSLFPAIYESTDVIGTLTPEASAVLGLKNDVRVVCGGVDNACMALGAGCISDGSTYTALGSSSWIAVTSSRPILHETTRPYVFAHCLPGKYVSATCIFASGSALKWARDTLSADLCTEAEQKNADVYDLMTTLATQSPVGSRKLIFNPSLAGGSSLDQSQNIRGAYIGLDLSHTRNDLLRAVLEGVALNLRLAMDALCVSFPIKNKMLLVGGGGKSDLWRQIFADVYNLQIIKTRVEQDAGALGAAALALVGCDIWSDFDRISTLHQPQQIHFPDPGNNKIYEQMLPVFRIISAYLSDAGDLMAGLGTEPETKSESESS
jgi:xylulokinase